MAAESMAFGRMRGLVPASAWTILEMRHLDGAVANDKMGAML